MSTITVDELVTRVGYRMDPASANLPEKMLVKVTNAVQKMVGGLGGAFAKMDTQFNGMMAKVKAAEAVSTRSSSKMVSAFGGLSRMLGPLATGFGAFQLGKFAIGSAADMERLQAEFGVMLGSAEKAQAMINNIQQLASKTPLTTTGITRATKTLIQFGVAEAQAVNTIRQLGDVAGGSQERLDSLSLAFAQTTAAGKLMGQDLLQYVNAGFNPLKVMADNPEKFGLKPGTGVGMLKDMMSKGKISANQVALSLRVATSEGGKFFQNMEKQSKTLGGLWSTLMDNIQIMVIRAMQPVLPILKGIIDWMAQIDWTPIETGIKLTVAAVKAFYATLKRAGIVEGFEMIKVAVLDVLQAFGLWSGGLKGTSNSIDMLAIGIATAVRAFGRFAIGVSATIQILMEFFNFFGINMDSLKSILVAIPGLWLAAFGPKIALQAFTTMSSIAASGASMWATLTTSAAGFTATLGGIIALLGVTYWAYQKIKEAEKERQNDEDRLAARQNSARFENRRNELQAEIIRTKGIVDSKDAFFQGERGKREKEQAKIRLSALQAEQAQIDKNMKAAQEYENDVTNRLDGPDTFSRMAENIMNNQKVVNLNQTNNIEVPVTVDDKGQSQLTPKAVQSIVDTSVRSIMNVEVLGLLAGRA